MALGLSDPHRRHSLRARLPEHDQAADLLSVAADAFVNREYDFARKRLREADNPILYQFARQLMDRKDPTVHWPARLNSASTGSVVRANARMPTDAEKLKLYVRDGWRCRYCGCRVIYGRARDVLRAAFPDEVPWPARGPMHGGFFALAATADHVVAHARGGDNSAANLVTACWPCNFGMEHDSLESLGLSDPRLRTPVVDTWDGLTRLIKAVPQHKAPVRKDYKNPEPRRMTVKTDKGLDAWLVQLTPKQVAQARELIAVLEDHAHLGVTWTAKDVLVARMTVGAYRVEFFGVERSMAVQVPWSTNTEKPLLRRFAIELAAGIPEATLRETPKLWNVDVSPDKSVPVSILLDNKEAVRTALMALHASLTQDCGDSVLTGGVGRS